MAEIIIRTNSEDKALIPDKWVLGTGMSTGGLYIVHTDTPFMILQYPPDMEEKTGLLPCIVYLNGEINPITFNRLFAEAWEILGIYKGRMTSSPRDEKP